MCNIDRLDKSALEEKTVQGDDVVGWIPVPECVILREDIILDGKISGSEVIFQTTGTGLSRLLNAVVQSTSQEVSALSSSASASASRSQTLECERERKMANLVNTVRGLRKQLSVMESSMCVRE